MLINLNLDKIFIHMLDKPILNIYTV